MGITVAIILIGIVWGFIYLIKESNGIPVMKPVVSHVIPPPNPRNSFHKEKEAILNNNNTLPLPLNLLAGEKKCPPRALFFSRDTTVEGEYEERYLNTFELKHWNYIKSLPSYQEKTKNANLEKLGEKTTRTTTEMAVVKGSGEGKTP